MNAEFHGIATIDKKAFLNQQCEEIEYHLNKILKSINFFFLITSQLCMLVPL